MNRNQSQDGLLTGGLRSKSHSFSESEDNELWIIARSSETQAEANDDLPGSGTLMTRVANKEVPMPLKHTDVRASVSGYIGTVQVVQQFHNPYDTKIEAVYVFPLPHNAAVNEFIMTIGDRRIRGIIRERQEAEEIYQAAKRQGYVASLLTEERPNIFTQSVANIEPGKAIDVTIKYFHTLAYVDGWYEFVFPMVVGPRFNPLGSTTGIGAIALGEHGASGQKTEIQYLQPHERNGHDISLRVDVEAGVTIEEFQCVTHAVSHESPSSHQLAVTLQPHDTLPNKDFVLHYRVAGERTKSSLLTHRDARGGYFTLMIYPPEELASLARQPLELVFVLDCSGSMSGIPIAQAKAAVERGLRLLRPGDSFQLINFSMNAAQLGHRPLEATPANIERGLAYLHSLKGEGGTMMIKGIQAALDFPHDPQRLRFVCFLTDGYIGNEGEILHEIHQRLGASRIFSFGVGSSPNRYLLNQMAKAGRGAVAYLGPRDDGAQVMEDFFNRISHPALTDLQIDWGGMQVEEVFPRAVPDLFVGRPVILTGRFNGNGDTVLRVAGSAANVPVSFIVPAPLADGGEANSALPSVWARMKIADLADQSLLKPDAQLPDHIKQVALDYNLMSAYTAFIAVDSTRQTDGSEGVIVPVAVPVPEGVRYDTTVKED
ncbi:MAG: VWA domain-containing protein [Verrucomicrobia bacterium]|nr:VWA domain-containing protein [Verrucomicrobiota bacterium]